MAPTDESSTQVDDARFKVLLAGAYKECKDDNTAIGEILSEFERTFADELAPTDDK